LSFTRVLISLALASFGYTILLKIKSFMMAEGVVSAPFLPSRDQGRKGGFEPLPKQHPFTC
jgi:hypothetical protein